MAQGPDPNRWKPRDPGLPPREPQEAEPIGSPPTTRLGMPGWAIALVAVVVLAIALLWMSRY
jgi:hypothetical protein